MGRRADPLSEISADAAEISASGLKIFPYERSVPLTEMKNVEMRMRRRNYVIDFSNFQVNISINVKFHPGRWDKNNHMNAREIYSGYRDHVNGPLNVRIDMDYVKRLTYILRKKPC